MTPQPERPPVDHVPACSNCNIPWATHERITAKGEEHLCLMCWLSRDAERDRQPARVWAQVLHIMRVLKEHPLNEAKERKC